MKKIFTLLFSTVGLLMFSQKIESFETILNDKISIRAIELYDNKVWYSGTESKFGFVDLKNNKAQKQIKLSEKKLQFRTLTQDDDAFYAINIESPAYFFKIDKRTLKPEIFNTDSTKTAFYDSFIIQSKNVGLAISDPHEDGVPNFFNFHNSNNYEVLNYPKYNKGEAHFAASNSNISMYKDLVWIATGGTFSRIFKFGWKYPLYWEVFDTPFVQGQSAGIYSIDFANQNFGVAVGGDYTKQEANVNNIATTNDGGKTWQIQASGKNSGYTTCVKIKPNSKGKEMISVGDQHISYSSDFGKTWKKISDEKGFYVCKWVDGNTVVFAGKDKISLMKLKF
ncbi:hypothetical protein AB670_02850 [Chryseobacterium sp. MOF25P]|uniref:WD40/YVTN/BNR-like repeat-containing protein n=1 Tax=unclassified Chryseobacterium TaxID=2593645 RepID=UPI0008053267|nr:MULTISPECIES: sialidase family protein [unclassified Chryseobacterium]OBW40899.1 hypothetical protein AB670_02850 [Chryseobacterium sp. MOF25P]OBW45154.1 hypothetical protein AB671_02747 [Chryseobacterium sp. BGARF1]